MKRLLKGLLTILLLLFVSGCGGGGTSGNGTTVSVTAGISNGTAGSVFAHMSSNGILISNPMSITLTSVATLPTGSTVPISSVNVVGITTSFTSLPFTSFPANTANAISPTLVNPDFAINPQGLGGVIPGPGSLKIDGIDILGLNDMSFLVYAASKVTPNPYTSIMYHYTATLAFHCVEANTGDTFVVYEPVGVAFQY